MTATPQPPPGAAAALATFRQFGRETTPQASDVTVGTTLIQLVPNNPRRVELILTNWGQGPVAVGFQPTITATTGTPIPPNGGTQTWLVTEDGQQVSWAFFAISATAGNAVHIEEVLAV